MERFEINKEAGLELFTSFIGGTKEKLSSLVDNIKENIKKYETEIENAVSEIAEATSSREKCENEIIKMQNKIDSIKDGIENVENTYKKIVEAYSTTSKGETKEIYSDIIDGAKANCEKDVEKSRNDIALLNSDIESIKNNILEFNRIIEEQEKNLDSYKLELDKYKKANEYIVKANDTIIKELEEISEGKPKAKVPVKKATSPKEPKAEPKKKEETAETKTVKIEEPIKEEIIEPTPVIEEPKTEEVKDNNLLIDDAIQRIYDLTGYKKEVPKTEPIEETKPIVIEESPVIEETKKIFDNPEEPIYTDNLENLFSTPSEDVVATPNNVDYNDTDMFEWEKILNGADEIINAEPTIEEPSTTQEPISIETPVKSTIIENANDTVNQLLKPYGTTFEKLQSLVGDSIIHKDGSTTPFMMTTEDVVKAINAVDGNDLRAMKTVGPEITIIRIVKKMKEGK